VPSNPFEDESAAYLVVVNDENQHSLWPADIDVPAGWAIVHPSDSRQNCLAYVEEHWTDLRPASLVAAMEETASSSGDR
jgi:MbtH protein